MLRTGTGEITRRRRIIRDGTASQSVYYACLNGIGRPRFLARGEQDLQVGGGGGSGPGAFQLVGPYVTFAVGSASKYFVREGGAVEQYDLRSNRPTFIASIPSGAEILGSSSVAGVYSADLVADARGAAAWVLASMVNGSPVTLLLAHDADGTQTLDSVSTPLESPYQITHLRLTEGLLTWLDRGQPRSAQLAQ